jgi:putative acetyltransferase
VSEAAALWRIWSTDAMEETQITICREDPRQLDVRALIAASDAYLGELYPAASNHLVDVDGLASADAVFLVGRRNQSALGTIAFRVFEPGHAEIKRMFVSDQARGFGLGRRLLVALEDAARRQGITRLSLETGIRQPEAIGLYRSAGYLECQPFGEYKPDPLSLFMSKRID